MSANVWNIKQHVHRAFSSFLFGFELPSLDLFYILFFLFCLSSTGFALVIRCKTAVAPHVHFSMHYSSFCSRSSNASTRTHKQKEGFGRFSHFTSRFARALVHLFAHKSIYTSEAQNSRIIEYWRVTKLVVDELENTIRTLQKVFAK